MNDATGNGIWAKDPVMGPLETIQPVKDSYPNLRSSVNEIGQTTTQILHFIGDIKRTLHGVISEKIKEGEFTKLFLKDGRMIMVSKRNLLLVEVFTEDEK